MIEVEKRLTIDAIEEIYGKINGKDDDMLLPKTLDSSDFSIVPAVIQLVCTWVRRTNQSSLRVNINDSESEVQEFIKEDFAFTSVVMAWSKKILTKDGKNDLRTKLRPYNEKIHFAMKSLTGITGQKLLLTCFDHLEYKKGYLDCFYDKGFFLTEGAISFSLDASVRKVLSFNKAASAKSVAPIIEDLIGVIYEAMKNTDDWARKDSTNQPVYPNARGVHMRFVKKKQSTLIERYSNHKGFRDYFESFKPNRLGEIYFLEVSIFDSGPGLIRSYKRTNENNYDVGMQVDIIKECLIKHCTSAPEHQKEGRGLGLDRILRILDGKGFLWIRTGNVSVYRNLKLDGYIETNDFKKVALFDWFNQSLDNYTKLTEAEGCLISIVYPIAVLEPYE